MRTRIRNIGYRSRTNTTRATGVKTVEDSPRSWLDWMTFAIALAKKTFRVASVLTNSNAHRSYAGADSFPGRNTEPVARCEQRLERLRVVDPAEAGNSVAYNKSVFSRHNEFL